MDKRRLAHFIEEEIKTSEDNILKHIIFLHDPHKFTEGWEDDSLSIFGADYQIARYNSDFDLRRKVERYKDIDKTKICIISNKEDNSFIQDYTGWRSNNVLLTPQSLLERETDKQWCEGINIIGNLLTKHEREVVTYREKIGKKSILPHDAKAIIISAIVRIDFTSELTPTDAYLFLYPLNNFKLLATQMPELDDYIKERLGQAIPFINDVLKSEELYESFPDYLWLSYIIRKLGKDPEEYMRGISQKLNDRFRYLRTASKAMYELSEELQKTGLDICKRQVSAMEERILEEDPEARKQFIRLIEKKPKEPLVYYSRLAELDTYTKTGIEILSRELSNYIIKTPIVSEDKRLLQIINDVQQHWFINEYKDQLQLLTDLKAFYEHSQQLGTEKLKEPSSYEEWITIYTKQLVPFESSYSNIEINPQFRIISRDNRKHIREDYEKTIWKHNIEFQEFIVTNYPKWIKTHDRPILTADFLEKIFKRYDPLRKYRYVYIIIIDCMRVDVWNLLRRKLLEKFEILDENYMLSMIPTATIFSRTSIFSGKLPRESLTVPERGIPSIPFGGEREALASALNIPPNNIEFTSQAESAVKIDEIDRILESQKKLKVVVLNSVDNKIHRATAGERLGKLKQDFLSIYETVIESILDKLGEEEDLILFITSDHGFVDTKRIAVIEFEKGYIHPRYIDLNLDEELNDEWAVTLSASDLGVAEESSEKRYAFPRGHLSFRRTGKFGTIRKRFRDGVVYGHGGLTLQEMILPCSVLVPRRDRSIKQLQIKIKSSECMEEKDSIIAFEVKNPNYLPVSQVIFQTNIAPPIYIPSIEPEKTYEFKINFVPKNNGETEIDLKITYRLQEQFHEKHQTKIVSVSRNLEIVKRPMDDVFDRLMR